MDREIVVRLHGRFEDLVHQHADSDVEYWCARDLQGLLGYAHWRSFAAVVDKAITACEKAGYDPKDHFAPARKMVELGSGAKRQVEDIALTRYACYLIAQNGDPSKDPIAFAQTYFAVQTRKQEIIEQRLAEAERLGARKKLTQSEKQLSGIIFDRLRENESFGRIRSKGDQAPSKRDSDLRLCRSDHLRLDELQVQSHGALQCVVAEQHGEPLATERAGSEPRSPTPLPAPWACPGCPSASRASVLPESEIRNPQWLTPFPAGRS